MRAIQDRSVKMLVRRFLPLLMDSIFIVLALYFVLTSARAWFVFAEPWSFFIYQAFFVAVQIMAFALFLIRKNPVACSSKSTDYVFTLGGLGSPMLFQVASGNGPSVVGEWLVFVGGFIVLSAMLSLNTSFGIAPENRSIKTRGMYRIVRHPMYMGYILAETGFLISNFSFFNVLILTASVIFLLLRLRAEERLLLEDPAYKTYARKLPWKLIPFIL